MAKFEVLHHFEDLQDNRYSYSVGDTYPRSGVVVSDERINELKSDKNRRGMPLIKEVRRPRNKKKEE